MSHRVVLEPSGEHFETAAAETVLDAALRHGLNLPHSCRGGSCLSCRARVLSGSVDYPRGLPPALSEEDRAEGYALLCQAHAASDLTVAVRPVETPANVRIRRLPCRVQSIEPLTHDVVALRLKLPGFEPFEFLPGQYIDILLSQGRRRSFSMANPPHDAGVLELHVRRVSGGAFTARVFDRLKVRELLRLEGPLGQFYLREDSPRPLVLVAGGTGFAPVKSILRHLFERAADPPRPAHLYWGVRAARDLYDLERIERWAAEQPGFRFTPVLSEPAPGDPAELRRGLVHEAVLADHRDSLDRYDVYVCGPPPLIEAARHDFAAAGLPSGQLFFDSFEFASPGA